MSIQTTQILGDDGKAMTPEQIEIARLKKSDALLKEQNAEFKKSDALRQEEIAALEARVAALERKNRESGGNYPTH